MFTLEKRKYTWLDMYRIPFRCAPVSTVIVTLQKITTALVNVFQVIAVAEFLDRAVTAVTEQKWDNGLALWFVLMLLIACWKRVSYNIGRLFTRHLVLMGNRQVLEEFTEKQNRLEYCLLEDPETEELTNRVTDRLEENLSEMLQRFLNFFAIYIPRIAGVLLIIASQVWWLAIVVMLMTIPLVFLSLKGGRKVYRADQEAAVYERRHKYLFEVLTGRETAEERSLFGYTPKVNEQWYGQFEAARKIDMKADAAFTVSMQGGSIVTSILASAVCLIMIPLTVSGALSIGLFISLAAAIYDLVNLMGWEMTRAVSQIARFGEYMRDLTAFAALPERGESAPEDTAVPAFERLEFRNVTFRYPGSEADVLKDFSMELERGRHYAIVGENGAGKSTLIKLMMGLYRDYEGEILYNGVELRRFPQKRWFEIFSCVFQDFARYSLSVEENICLGTGKMEAQAAQAAQTDQTAQRMQAAAEKLGLHEAVK